MATYTVVAGDTMWKIANDHGVTLDALIAANPQIPDPNMISVGQVINLPHPPAQNPPAPAPAPGPPTPAPGPGPGPGTPGPIFNPSPSHPTPSHPGGLKTVAYFTNWVRFGD